MIKGKALLALLMAAASCGTREKTAREAASQATEVRRLVAETKHYTDSLEVQAGADGASAARLDTLAALLEQLRHDMDERAQASAQGADVTQSESQIAADVSELQQVDSTLEALSGDAEAPSASGHERRALLDRISENIGKMIQIVQQGQELAGALHSAKQDADGSDGPSDDGPPAASPAPAEATNEPGLQSTELESAAPAADTEPSSSGGATLGGLCCRSSPNLGLGRLGRLIVEFPVRADSRVDVFKPGQADPIQSGYGSHTWDLLPGNYAVAISGKRVDGVIIRSRHDTRVRVGILRIHAGGGTRVDLLDRDGKAMLTSGYVGSAAMVIGLPTGTIRVQIAGQTEAVTIREGKVTDF